MEIFLLFGFCFVSILAIVFCLNLVKIIKKVQKD